MLKHQTVDDKREAQCRQRQYDCFTDDLQAGTPFCCAQNLLYRERFGTQRCLGSGEVNEIDRTHDQQYQDEYRKHIEYRFIDECKHVTS